MDAHSGVIQSSLLLLRCASSLLQLMTQQANPRVPVGKALTSKYSRLLACRPGLEGVGAPLEVVGRPPQAVVRSWTHCL